MVRSVWPPSRAGAGRGGAEAPSSGRCGSLRAELGRGAGQHPTGGRCLPGRSGPFRVGGLGMSPGPGWTAGPHLAVRGRVATGGSARPLVPSSVAGRPLHRAAKGHRPGFGTAPQPASGPPFSRPDPQSRLAPLTLCDFGDLLRPRPASWAPRCRRALVLRVCGVNTGGMAACGLPPASAPAGHSSHLDLVGAHCAPRPPAPRQDQGWVLGSWCPAS